MKYCEKCEKTKELSEFGKDLYKPGGLNTYCKECIRKRSKEQRENDPDYHKNYAIRYREINKERLKNDRQYTYYRDHEKRLEQGKRSYYKNKEKIAKKRAEKSRTAEVREKNRIRQAEWRKKNGTAAGKAITKWKKSNPQKAAAHALVLWAIKTGVLVRKENCEECGKVCKTEGHHEDYLKPMEVIWLCRSCHTGKHRKYR